MAERTSDANLSRRGPGRPPLIPKVRLAERAAEIAAALFERATHLDPALDAVAVNELARLCAYAEGIDADVERRGLTTGSGGLRGAAKLRMEVTRAIASWTSLLGANPKSRAEILGALRSVSQPTFSESYQRRLAALRSGDATDD